MTLISIIIPTYNPSAYLREAIESVVCQSYDDVEIIVIDDGSDAEFRSIIDSVVEAYPMSRLIRKPTNRGVSSARNRGLEVAKGDFILFLDDDDLLAEGVLKAGMTVFDMHPEADVVMTRGEVLYEGASESQIRRQKAIFEYNQRRYARLNYRDPSFFLVYTPPIHCLLFRRQVFQKGRFDEELKYGEDRMLWLYLRKRGIRFISSDFVGGYYRLADKSTSQDKGLRIFFRKLLSSGILSTRFERGYVISFLFLLELKSGAWVESLVLGSKALLYPEALVYLLWKFLVVRHMG